jgi:hypothetical protein
MEKFVALEVGFVAGESGGLSANGEAGKCSDQGGPELGFGHGLVERKLIIVPPGELATLREENDFHGINDRQD